MLRRIWLFITDTRKLALLGVCIMAAVFLVGAELLEIALPWTLAAIVALFVLAALVWAGRRWWAMRRARLLEAEITAPDKGPGKHDMAVVRDGMLKAIATIKDSRLGMVAGKRALYELPWYQALDRGMMEDAEGQPIDFRNVVVIATCNTGSAAIMQACLNKEGEELPTPDELQELVRPQLMKHFRPAFIGRVQVLPYYPVSDTALRQIIALKLHRVAARLADAHKVDFRWQVSLEDAILARCTEADAGARNVDNIINGQLLPEIAKLVLARIAEGRALSALEAGEKDDVLHVEELP